MSASGPSQVRAFLSPPNRIRRGLGGVLLIGVIAVSACAKTSIDTTITEPPAATTTTLPSGSSGELLARLVDEAAKLSDLIGTAGNKGEQMQLVANLWNAARPAIAADNAELASTFDAAVELCSKATRLNRPADADKCTQNLTALTNGYLD